MSDDMRRYLDPKVLSKITRLDLKARLVVEGYISGMHKSPYHGYSVEFAEHREYVPGDDIKHIDWKVWAKADRFYIKQYEEETNLRSHILLDASASMRYGSGAVTKFDYACTVAASLAYLLQQQQDAVGLVLFDRRVRRNLPASSHPAHLKTLLHELAAAKPDDKSDVTEVFHGLAEQIRKRGMVILISDLFLDIPALIRSLQHFRHKRHEVVVFHVLDDYELRFPFEDNTLFRGLEAPIELLTEPRALRNSYLDALNRYLGEVRKGCVNNLIDYVRISTADPLDGALSAYLAYRQKTLRGGARR